MRKLLVVLSVAGLAACSSTKPQTAMAPQPTVQPVQAVTAPQASMSSIPEWFTSVPNDEDHIYAVGDGVSGSASGALGNARANAFEGICQGSGGTVRSQTKIYRQDTETGSKSVSTTAIRNFCADVNVAGSHVEKSNIVVENGRYHAFVLVALPLGDKNKVTKAQRERTADLGVKTDAQKEFKELDELNNKAKSDAPVSDAAPVSQVQSITLMNVDNEEYKAKRDAALQKSGAVIGQTTLR
jgi:hypothetical protein